MKRGNGSISLVDSVDIRARLGNLGRFFAREPEIFISAGVRAHGNVLAVHSMAQLGDSESSILLGTRWDIHVNADARWQPTLQNLQGKLPRKMSSSGIVLAA